MKTEIPKQFLLLQSKPVLLYTLNTFKEFAGNDSLILVLPEAHIALWNEICSQFDVQTKHTVVAGGPTRFHSVKSGLSACKNKLPDSIVAIHDGVRPFVGKEVIDTGFSIAERKGSAIPVIPITDSVRRVKGAYSTSIPREELFLVQTPQFFMFEQIQDAYKHPYSQEFTDDASVYEACGHQVTLFEGNKENIKITEHADLQYASLLANNF